MHLSHLVALGAAVATTASAQTYQGFNYGSTNTDNSPVLEAQFQNDFTTAQKLVGTSGFTSARIYTIIQAGTTNTPTQAIQAAINTKTSLLLGLWASSGQATINDELAALSAAISQHGTAFTDLITGISVGSEDLYRISPTGIINKSDPGASPDEVVNYIGQVRKAIAGTPASSKPVGHVDTWTAWVNGSNSAVINACDFIGMDAYPYFQNTMPNGIGNGYSLFFDAYDQTVAAVGNKPVWVTETGWPVSGSTSNQAVPSLANAKTYWDQVGCNRLFGKINTYWFTLQDSYPTTPNPSFGIVGSSLSTSPLYDLSCSGVSSAVPSSVSQAATSSVNPASVQAGGNGGAQHEASAIASATTSAPVKSANGTVTSVQGGGATVVYTTVTTCPATSVSGSSTVTYLTTSTVVVTSCSGGCAKPTAPSTLITKTSALPSATAGACPANLNGAYEYPHLIVPVDKSQPTKQGGTSYNGTISSTVSSLFNFDIPNSDTGKTCTVIFLLPTQDKLTTSAFSLSGSGGLDVALLSSPATEQTSYNTVPSVEKDYSGPSSVTPGNAYVIQTGACPSGKRIGLKVSATGTLNLNYFQDYNPSPIGLYVTVC